MKRTLATLALLVILFPIRGQELVWEKMERESRGGLSEDLVVVKGKIWMSALNELFVSTDGGVHWSYVHQASAQGISGAGAINTTFGSHVKILVSGDTLFFGNTFSPDNGVTWQPWTLNGTSLPKKHLALTVMATHGKKMYLGTMFSGFFQSTNVGASFSNMNSGFPVAYGYYESARAVAFYNDQPVVATHSGLHVWNGSTWLHPAGNGLPTTVVNTTTAKLIDRICFLNSTWIVSTNFGIYYSYDQGNNWQRFNAIPELTDLGAWNLYSKPAVFYNLDVMNGKIMVSYESSLYISSDGGTTWKHTEMANRVEIKKIISVDSTLLAATSGGVYRSIDGGTRWLKSNQGFERQLYNVYASGNEGFLTSVGAGILKVVNDGKTLLPFNNGMDLLKRITISAIAAEKIYSTQIKYYSYAGTSVRWDYRMYETESRSADWRPLDSLPVQTPYLFQASANRTIAVTGSNPLSGGRNEIDGIYLTTDDGKNWKKVFQGVTHIGNSYDDNVTALLFEDDTLYAGGNMSGVFKSWDQGTTWTPINNGISLPDLSDSLWWQDPDAQTTVHYVTMIKKHNHHLYMIGENYLYYNYGAIHVSTDGGKKWVRKDFSSLGPDFEAAFPTGFVIAPDGTLYTRLYTNNFLDSHMAVSYDNADTWELFAVDFPDGYIYSYNVIGSYFYASGKTGLWRFRFPDLPDGDVITHTDDLPFSDVSLYPNPFTSHVTLSLSPSNQPEIVVEILASDGRRVLKKILPAGTVFTWHAIDDAGGAIKPGLYFLRVTQGQKITTQRIIKY